ncbi:MAG: hypothetical protein K9H61_04410 [Bacteroidia bacterium]|nr:hypothetical protein [Bacteroidia bacterium]MCF8427306.1 hypothetical protein [Bacteroidia bacterium]MCF8446219.1 hypothetical protein [Bacteroidia bacterium]
MLPPSIGQLSIDKLQDTDNKKNTIGQAVTDQLSNTNNSTKLSTYYRNILERISYTHFIELIKIEKKTKRTFFELLILKTTPSVKEFKRQINTLAYERVGLSENLELANEKLLGKITPELPEQAIKIYILLIF